MQFFPGNWRRIGHLGLATMLVGLSACGDDGPTGPSADFDIAGDWSWRVTDASASNASCSVTGVTLTFQVDNGALTGHRVANGGGNVTCTINGSPTTSNYTSSDEIDDLSLNGEVVEFTFATTSGPWEMTGTITNDDRIDGTATIRLGTTIGIMVLTGPWRATRI